MVQTSLIAHPEVQKTGLLKVEKNKLYLWTNTSMFPVYNGSTGYVFTEVKLQGSVQSETEDSITIKFRPAFGEEDIISWMANNNNHGVSVIVRMTWEVNGSTTTQDFRFSSDLVSYVYENDKAFVLGLTGISGIENKQIQCLVKSDTGTEFIQQVVE